MQCPGDVSALKGTAENPEFLFIPCSLVAPFLDWSTCGADEFFKEWGSRVFRLLALGIMFAFGASVFAQEPQVNPLTFQSWKEQQVLESQNQVLRVSARIAHLRSGKGGTSGTKDSIPLPSSKIKKSEMDSVLAAEKDLRRAQDSLKAATELTLEEYIAIYLPTLRESPESLQTLSQKMSKEELAEIFKVLLRKDIPPDTKRNSSSLADIKRAQTM